MMRRCPRPLAVLLSVAALTLAGCARGSLLDRLVSFWSVSALGIVVVILNIIALVDLAASPRPALQKFLWGAVIILLPYLGCLLYYLFGRRAYEGSREV